eukprot:TRINITY_DN1552_c0_g1_i4.p1 TRINITY_DN1552_c0_g1~~TRINITY_DN1552_c0_g1_i4.p1  ORF type:complete len:337 (+),score=130.38 TRINITY_DN1552_c0_g1_i4:228-1238(+)
MASIPIAMGSSPPNSLSGSGSNPRAKSFDPQSVVEFFSRTRAYDVMPENGKVAVVEDSLTLADLLEVLAEHRLGACALWSQERCLGLITPAALCALLVRLASESGAEELEASLEITLAQAVADKELTLETESASPDATVLQVLRQMHRKTQLLQICEPNIDCPVFLVSFARILRYVMSHFHDAEGDTLLEQSIGSLSAVHQSQVPPIQSSVTVLEAFDTLVSQQLSYVPVLDAEGQLVALLTPEDMLPVAMSSQRWLARPLSELIASCEWSDTLQAVVLLEELFVHFLHSPGAEPEHQLDTGAGVHEPEPEDPEEEDAVTMQFGRFAVTDFEDDDE